MFYGSDQSSLQHVQLSEELEGTVYGSSPSPELILFCIVCASSITSSYPKASWYSECFIQTRYTIQTVFAIQIPRNGSQKKVGVLIYLSLNCMYLCIFLQMSPPLYSVNDGQVKNREIIFFFFFSPKFINCEQWQVASTNVKFLMLLINEFDYAMELNIPKKIVFAL